MVLSLLACSAVDTDPVSFPDIADVNPTVTSGETDGISWKLNERIPSIVEVSWQSETPGQTWVRYRFDEEWLETPVSQGTDPANTLLLGVPYDTEVTFQALGKEGWASKEITVNTGPLPAR